MRKESISKNKETKAQPVDLQNRKKRKISSLMLAYIILINMISYIILINMINHLFYKIKHSLAPLYLDLPSTLRIILNLVLLYCAELFVTFIIWTRLFRERIPKDIPFEIDWIGFLIFGYLSIIYLYLIIKIIFKFKESKGIISKILSSLSKIIYFPLIALEKNLLEFPIYKEKYIFLFTKIFNLVNNRVNERNITYIYLVINIIPRLILGINLCIDVFVYSRIENFYKYVGLMLIILLSKLIIHAFEQVKEELTLKLESMCNPEGLITDYLTPEEEAEDWTDEDISILLTFGEGRQSRKSIRDLVEIQTLAKIFKNKQYFVGIDLREEYVENFCLRNNINRDNYTMEIAGRVIKEYQTFFPLAIDLSVFIYRYNYQVNKPLIKNIQLIVYILYLMGWLAVLCKNMEISELEFIKKIIQEILNIIISIRSPQEN